MPALAQGAWSSQETYSAADVSSIVAYAKDRAVRVMIEVDTPGHSAAWGVGVPDVIPDCPGIDGGRIALDPTRNETYATVEALLGELGTLAPDPFFHLGGDEVRPDCWTASARVQAFMKDHGFTTIGEVENFYFSKLLGEVVPAALGASRKVVIYQEVFDNNVTLPAAAVIDVWKAGRGKPGDVGYTRPIPEEIAAIVKAGHSVVLANGNDRNWYLNDGWGNSNINPLWSDVWVLDPANGTDALLTPAEQSKILGGEASLWGEEIDGGDLIQRAWPRAAAFAERLWSPRTVAPRTAASLNEVAPRLARFGCKLKARGLAAQISPARATRRPKSA